MANRIGGFLVPDVQPVQPWHAFNGPLHVGSSPNGGVLYMVRHPYNQDPKRDQNHPCVESLSGLGVWALGPEPLIPNAIGLVAHRARFPGRHPPGCPRSMASSSTLDEQGASEIRGTFLGS